MRWAEAAYDAGFDGLAWASRKCNGTRAIVLFGNRCAGGVVQDWSFARINQSGPSLDWLIATCGPLYFDVLPPPRPNR